MVLVAIALTMSVASATDWSQFQKDENNSGWTTDCAPIYDPPTLAWSYNVDGWVDTTPIVGGDRVFVLNSSGTVYAFKAKTGAVNWTSPASHTGTFEVSVPAYNDGIVYVARSKGALNQGYCNVSALYANNGTVRESITLKTTGGYQLNTPITYADDRIYLGDWNGSSTTTNGTGTYWCLNASDVTNVLWNYTPNSVGHGYYWAGAAIVGDYAIFGDDDANVTCIDIPASCLIGEGVVKDYINVSEQCGSTYPVEEIRSSIVWNEGAGRIYFTAKSASYPPDGHLYAVAFDPTTGYLGGDGAMGGGSCEWTYPIHYSTSTPVVYNDRVYVGAGGLWSGGPPAYGVTCLNEADGSFRYDTHSTTPTPGIVQASPAVSVWNGQVYIYFTTNAVTAYAYCFEDTGTALVQRWRYTAGNNALQGMAISRGMVFYGSDASTVWALAGICGDVNHNGIADMSDALATRNHWFYGFSLCSTWAADTNCNDIVDMSDALAIRNHWFYGFPLAGCCGC
jgi:outer membrane protein assembly factor BamB